MGTITSVEAKNKFSLFFDTQKPVLVTEDKLPVGVIISIEEAKNMLSNYFLEQVENNNMNIIEAIKAQSTIKKNSKKADEQIKKGEYQEATKDFFLNIRKKALNKE